MNVHGSRIAVAEYYRWPRTAGYLSAEYGAREASPRSRRALPASEEDPEFRVKLRQQRSSFRRDPRDGHEPRRYPLPQRRTRHWYRWYRPMRSIRRRRSRCVRGQWCRRRLRLRVHRPRSGILRRDDEAIDFRRIERIKDGRFLGQAGDDQKSDARDEWSQDLRAKKPHPGLHDHRVGRSTSNTPPLTGTQFYSTALIVQGETVNNIDN